MSKSVTSQQQPGDATASSPREVLDESSRNSENANLKTSSRISNHTVATAPRRGPDVSPKDVKTPSARTSDDTESADWDYELFGPPMFTGQEESSPSSSRKEKIEEILKRHNACTSRSISRGRFCGLIPTRTWTVSEENAEIQ